MELAMSISLYIIIFILFIAVLTFLIAGTKKTNGVDLPKLGIFSIVMFILACISFIIWTILYMAIHLL